MPQPPIEGDLDEAQRLQLLDGFGHGGTSHAVFELDGVVGFVDGFACPREGINLGIKRLLHDRQACVQPYLCGYPHPLELSFHVRVRPWRECAWVLTDGVEVPYTDGDRRPGAIQAVYDEPSNTIKGLVSHPLAVSDRPPAFSITPKSAAMSTRVSRRLWIIVSPLYI